MLNESDLSRVDLNLLVLFEAVLRELHVGRAADRLNISASAVSHGLGRLRRLLNDPVFLKTPKGVVPSARALVLAPAITDVLARVRSVVLSAGPFDPATATRRFTVGAPDGVSAVFLPRLLASVRASAPHIDIAVRQLLPTAGEPSPDRAWQAAFLALESRAMDAAVVPTSEVPLRFATRLLYEECFVLAMRAGHPLRRKLTLERYCAAEHLVVSLTGDPHGFVDEVLARSGLSRRVALTVPNFVFALAVIADTDLVCALPARFAAAYADRFGIVVVDSPTPLGQFRLNIVTPEVALMDAGIAWFVNRLEESAAGPAARLSR
ncbi:LysR family transcriptional regulator [Piscinibacter sp. HJYY11]|uniref:LysR family transcriptional regulator n=1 Tax=Piscinibacter sp. HJYY11 TaxID=2801333 RepID=UPI00191DA47C|nr:LysR family transcriptional regulator [Piscinibacter sp. HJYY11]MBL0727289.1 LysR family transcriptional regulator [Piscinibacter sp. HJYY11]